MKKLEWSDLQDMLDWGFKNLKEPNKSRPRKPASYWRGFLDATESISFALFPQEYYAYTMARLNTIDTSVN